MNHRAQSHKLCECGCGEYTDLMPSNNRTKGWVKGQPFRYRPNHVHRSKHPPYAVDGSTGCWVWQRAVSGRYGNIKVDGVQRVAHRVYFEQAGGRIPDRWHLHHLCENTLCVNPTHLKPMSAQEHVRSKRSTKLTEDVARQIRDSAAAGETQTVIADRHDISQGMVSRIVNGHRW